MEEVDALANAMFCINDQRRQLSDPGFV